MSSTVTVQRAYPLLVIGACVHVLLVIQLARAEGVWAGVLLEFLAAIPGGLAVLVGFRLLAAPGGTFSSAVDTHYRRLGMGKSMLAIGLLAANFAIVHLIAQRDSLLSTLILSSLALCTGFAVVGLFWWRESLRRRR